MGGLGVAGGVGAGASPPALAPSEGSGSTLHIDRYVIDHMMVSKQTPSEAAILIILISIE